ncbi:hypothetical protein T4E_8245 [Trichinella pseudospiralis]|uniref:Secreted protein n=1 Tax=Trichinella pseudospiralis TaxID=6337 RepID=A0A0V0YAR0_TRIPS|nr:hypothetical protein T4E_8245 [Trichinella pseudospiralis]
MLSMNRCRLICLLASITFLLIHCTKACNPGGYYGSYPYYNSYQRPFYGPDLTMCAGPGWPCYKRRSPDAKGVDASSQTLIRQPGQISSSQTPYFPPAPPSTNPDKSYGLNTIFKKLNNPAWETNQAKV